MPVQRCVTGKKLLLMALYRAIGDWRRHDLGADVLGSLDQDDAAAARRLGAPAISGNTC
jgi:hypothetical protein